MNSIVCKRSDIVYQFECIKKLSVIVSYQFEKYIYFLKISLPSFLIMTPFFDNRSHFTDFFVSPHADHLEKSYPPPQ